MNPASFSRRRFLALAAGTTAAAAALRAQPHAPVPGLTPTRPATVKPPALAATLVHEFVGAAHGDLAKVKEMLRVQPALRNACWDWGGGDFETALGGAAHMGRRDIAELLLGQGARLDVFAAAMLGRLEIVQAACAAFPGLAAVPGPHGIPLLAHAQKGGPEAAQVVAYLGSLVAGGK